MKDILLYDRIKETSHITGASDIILEGAAAGFSAFIDYLSVDDYTFYAITDGSKYEVGSGLLYYDSSDSYYKLTRNSVRSSESDNSEVSFSNNGIKEVYATYPGAFAVVSNPLDTPQLTRESGIAYWSGPQTLDSNRELVWDETNRRLGINTNAPTTALEIGGDNITSELTVSGISLGASGVNFINPKAGYFAGRQQEPFFRNSLCEDTSGILELSGDVDQIICFKPQTAGTFLGVPSGECPDSCGNNHPVFRTLDVEDIPNLSGLYVTQDEDADKKSGNVAFYKDEKHITFSDSLRLDTSTAPDELHVSGTIKVYDELIANSGIGTFMGNTVVNNNGLLVVPTLDTVPDVISSISAANVGAIAFASGDSYIMIANGLSWVSGQLN